MNFTCRALPPRLLAPFPFFFFFLLPAENFYSRLSGRTCEGHDIEADWPLSSYLPGLMIHPQPGERNTPPSLLICVS